MELLVPRGKAMPEQQQVFQTELQLVVAEKIPLVAEVTISTMLLITHLMVVVKVLVEELVVAD
jgi:hypothetical protein